MAVSVITVSCTTASPNQPPTIGNANNSSLPPTEQLYVAAFTDICDAECVSSSPSTIFLQLRGEAEVAKGELLALSDMFEMLPVDVDLFDVAADHDGSVLIFTIQPARAAGSGVVVVTIETNRIDHDAADYRADAIVLRPVDAMWEVVADPNTVGVTVTSSVS